MAEARGIVRLKGRGVIAVKARDYVGGDELGTLERLTQGGFAVAVQTREHLRSKVFKHSGIHTRSTHASDFLLVGEDHKTRIDGTRCLQQRLQRGIGADFVVLPIGGNETAIKANIARLSGRNERQLRRGELPRREPTAVFQQREQLRFKAGACQRV